VLSEFAAACRATAVAISEGLIAPLSVGDPSQSEIYVYNGIFFSKAEDTKDSFKVWCCTRYTHIADNSV
jgi:hypothetical protein